MPSKISMAAGSRFGRLIVLSETGERTRGGNVFWRCRCDCGHIKSIRGSSLRNGHSQSCGCLQREFPRPWLSNPRHGNPERRTPEYRSWESMLSRCERLSDPAYASYGGRGITVDPRWRRFETFLEDMGRRPSRGHSIDRVDNDGPYELWNCRWATAVEQARNTRANHRLTYQGKTMPLTAWAEDVGMQPVTLKARLRTGWSLEHALNTPVRRWQRR